MSKRTDINKILIIGSGPVVIGQGSEYDFAVYQALKALHEENYELVLVNSNPCAVSADTCFADHTYIEPLTLESITAIIKKERPQAMLAVFGGQTALNLAVALDGAGVLKQYSVEMLGADMSAITRSEDKKSFKETMKQIDVTVPRSGIADSIEDGVRIIKEIDFPAILRPAYTIGGRGCSITYNKEEFERMLIHSFEAGTIHQTLIEESIMGWKEIEVELIRDSHAKTLVIAAMECVEPVGVHTGDSTIVSPVQTLSKVQMEDIYEKSTRVANAIGVIGSINIKYAVNPATGDIVIIEVNPRFSRSTSLAAKVSGFPSAYAAAKLAVGIVLDELNDCCANFEPQKDLYMVKTSRFTFRKFPQSDNSIDTSMKSIGEAVAVGSTFLETLQKAIRALEVGRAGLERRDPDYIREKLAKPTVERLSYIRYAIESGISIEEISERSKIDKWFIGKINKLLEFEKNLVGKSIVNVPAQMLRNAKQMGYSDLQLAKLLETDEEQIRMRRKVLGIMPAYIKTIDCCLNKPYYYSTYKDEPMALEASGKKKIIIIGSGPNRIGQGSESDYVCIHTSKTLQEEGYETIIINSSSSAVSTAFGVSDKLYIEPLTTEDLLGVIEYEKPDGIIMTSALDFYKDLLKAGVNILGSSDKSIKIIEDRKLFGEVLKKLELKQSDYESAKSEKEALEKAKTIGYPVIVRNGRSLDGKLTEIIYDDNDLISYMKTFGRKCPGASVLIEKFIEDAVELDVDVITDGETTLVCGVMEHIEQAGVHSGDSACSIPPYSIDENIVEEIKRQAKLVASEIKAFAIFSMQFAVKSGEVYVLGADARESRTISFVSKATGVNWVKAAAKMIAGKSLKSQGLVSEVIPQFIAVSEAVFVFDRFPGADVVLGPEMKSAGKVMGIDNDFGNSYIKAEIAAGQNLPKEGMVFLSLAEKDKCYAQEIGKKLDDLGFQIVATRGTANRLKEAGIKPVLVSKIGEGRPDAIDMIKNDKIDLIINTPSGKRPRQHEITIRSAMVASGVPIITTISGARATLNSMEKVKGQLPKVKSLQEYYK